MAVTEEKQPRRSVSRKFLKQLETELETWKRQGTVTAQQADSILSQYVVVSLLYGRLIVILVTLGAILPFLLYLLLALIRPDIVARSLGTMVAEDIVYNIG